MQHITVSLTSKYECYLERNQKSHLPQNYLFNFEYKCYLLIKMKSTYNLELICLKFKYESVFLGIERSHLSRKTGALTFK